MTSLDIQLLSTMELSFKLVRESLFLNICSMQQNYVLYSKDFWGICQNLTFCLRYTANIHITCIIRSSLKIVAGLHSDLSVNSDIKIKKA